VFIDNLFALRGADGDTGSAADGSGPLGIRLLTI
jgi:hypothetical protein